MTGGKVGSGLLYPISRLLKSNTERVDSECECLCETKNSYWNQAFHAGKGKITVLIGLPSNDKLLFVRIFF